MTFLCNYLLKFAQNENDESNASLESDSQGLLMLITSLTLLNFKR